MKRTALFDAHQRLGAKLIEFGGWEMPVYYSTITQEHLAVRAAAGIFDISHMGEFMFEGPEAAAFLDANLTNNIHALAVGQGQYTLMCNAHGGVVDDLYAYRLAPTSFLLIVNASRIQADFAWLQQRWAVFPGRAEVKIHDASETTGAVAVQGPRVAEFINAAFPGAAIEGATAEQASQLSKNRIARFSFANEKIWISRTGYTGEDGFEVVAPNETILAVWERVLELGEPCGLQPAGLGARDTLRTEMCYPLYGQELDEETTPIEAGLGFFVALDKPEFSGRSVLAEQKANGGSKKLAAFKMSGKSAPPRPHYAVWSGGSDSGNIGQVTSGTQSPSLGVGIGMAYLPPAFGKAGTSLEIEIRGKRAAAVVAPKPLYRKPV